MAHNIVYKKSVRRDLKKLSKAEAQRILNQIEDDLSENSATYPLRKGQFAGLRKYYVRDSRVIYFILGNDVLILRIGHRKEVFKKEI